MALDSLQSAIENLRKMIEAQRRYLAENETRTRQVLIDPLLRELGWEISNPNIVQLEYWVQQYRMDYALMAKGKPLAVVEAKRLGSDLDNDQIMQVLNYANVAGINYIIITNGDTWEMYEVFKPAELKKRLLMRLKLSQQPAHRNALQALAIWKPNLAAKEPVFVSPKAVPDQTDVKSNEQQREQLPNKVSADAENLYSFASKQSYPSDTDTKPILLKIGDCVEKRVKSWRDVTYKVVSWLVDEGILSSNDCPIEMEEMGEWTFINSKEVYSDGTPFRTPQRLPNGLFWERGRGTNQVQSERLWKLLEEFNIDLSTIKVSYKSIGKASR